MPIKHARKSSHIVSMDRSSDRHHSSINCRSSEAPLTFIPYGFLTTLQRTSTTSVWRAPALGVSRVVKCIRLHDNKCLANECSKYYVFRFRDYWQIADDITAKRWNVNIVRKINPIKWMCSNCSKTIKNKKCFFN